MNAAWGFKPRSIATQVLEQIQPTCAILHTRARAPCGKCGPPEDDPCTTVAGCHAPVAEDRVGYVPLSQPMPPEVLQPDEVRKRELFFREVERGMPKVQAAYPGLVPCRNCPLQRGTPASRSRFALAKISAALDRQAFIHCTGSRMMEDEDHQRVVRAQAEKIQICTSYAALVCMPGSELGTEAERER